jgi:RNA polymerase sigma-70 factor (ECF subfamily)
MDEREIIKAILKGDTSKFRLLIDQYQPLVFSTLIGFVHNNEDAEDLTQEVLISVYKSLRGFKAESQFSTWIYRITVNMALNFVHRQHRRNIWQETLSLWQNQIDKPTEDKNPEEQMLKSEREILIQKAIDALSSKQRTVFILSRYDDLSQKEIAAVMHISEGAVEQHLQRAKQNLQKKLAHLVGK